MEETDWDAYESGRDPRCRDCMVHSGYEATVMRKAFSNPRDLARLLFWNLKRPVMGSVPWPASGYHYPEALLSPLFSHLSRRLHHASRPHEGRAVCNLGYALAWLSEYSSIHTGIPYGLYKYIETTRGRGTLGDGCPLHGFHELRIPRLCRLFDGPRGHLAHRLLQGGRSISLKRGKAGGRGARRSWGPSSLSISTSSSIP